MTKRSVDSRFGRNSNVKGKAVPLNANTIRLFLYFGIYLIILFDLVVFLIAIRLYSVS